jgi:hypothetical protein
MPLGSCLPIPSIAFPVEASDKAKKYRKEGRLKEAIEIEHHVKLAEAAKNLQKQHLRDRMKKGYVVIAEDAEFIMTNGFLIPENIQLTITSLYIGTVVSASSSATWLECVWPEPLDDERPWSPLKPKLSTLLPKEFLQPPVPAQEACVQQEFQSRLKAFTGVFEDAVFGNDFLSLIGQAAPEGSKLQGVLDVFLAKYDERDSEGMPEHVLQMMHNTIMACKGLYAIFVTSPGRHCATKEDVHYVWPEKSKHNVAACAHQSSSPQESFKSAYYLAELCTRLDLGGL